jgi:FAD/FMN-containing dehydrogenase
MLDINALRNSIQGEVLEVFSAEYVTDISGRAQKNPRVVVKTTCEADILHTLAIARAAQIPVSVRGGGFSFNGQTLNQDGILLVNYCDQPEFELKANGEVEVTGRTRWYELETALNREGRSVPVLTTFLGTTIGGTLSAGGYGPRSISSSAQVDHVTRLRLIQPDGTAIWCSPEENAELFRFSLAGQGQMGIIERAVLQTIPYKPVVAQYTYQHKTLAELVDSLEWLTADNDGQSQQTAFPDSCIAVMPSQSRKILSIYGYEYESQEAANAASLPEHFQHISPTSTNIIPTRANIPLNIEQMRKQYSKTVNLWTDWVTPWIGLRALMALIETRALNKYLDLLAIHPIRIPRIKVKLPFAAHHITDESIVFLVGLYYFVPPEDKAGIDHCMSILKMLQDLSIQLGGRPYLYGVHELDERQKRSLYGTDYDRMKALRLRVDPLDLLNAHAL